MATAVIMPKQGQSVETCIITKWFKNKGENVSVGDILFSYETDKAAFDLESPAEGILLDLFFGEGAEVPVLVNVAVIGKRGEATNSFDPEQTTHPAPTASPTASSVSKPDGAPSIANAQDLINVSSSPDSKIRISPRAKRMAEDKGLNYNNLQGSGPNGRIITSDIEKVLSGAVVGAKATQAMGVEFTEQPLSNVRKLIAKTMHASLQNSAQLTHHMSADVRHLLEARQKIKNDISSGKSQQDITLNDMVCFCVIRALEKFPGANSHFLDDRIKTFHKVHLGIAVDTPRGLMVPSVKNAGDMDLVKLSKELKSVADACRKGSISPELIQSTAATFTVSNLGSYGVEMFTPVINLPQVGILGVCTIINRPANIGNNIFGFVPFIGLSLTYDHRAIDGGPATMFLKEIKEQIESFRY
ncbi:MAG: dihydrolipoamide acetyltransferase family protein [Bacteroidia bacterium]|nr:dihydrolipoamide acetyltransferase family protein [Bacteroidia bacterium]